MHTGALVPRRGTTAGVPGPRRNADECDAGWFAPVATRRRSMLGLFGPSPKARSIFPEDTPGPRVALCSGLFGPSPKARSIFPGDTPGAPGRPMLGPLWALAESSQYFPGDTPGPRVALCSRVLGSSECFPVGVTPDLCGAKRCGEALGVLWRCECFALVLGRSRGAGPACSVGRYSVLRNSMIATMSIPRPMAATMASDSHTGTGQPAQVMPGASWCMASGLRFRWLNTACRIGSTM